MTRACRTFLVDFALEVRPLRFYLRGARNFLPFGLLHGKCKERFPVGIPGIMVQEAFPIQWHTLLREGQATKMNARAEVISSALAILTDTYELLKPFMEQ